MKTITSRSLAIPTDEDGFLDRECPRCYGEFRIDIGEYQDLGYMNLRCPYCRFISELDMFSTTGQQAYLATTLRNLAFDQAEQLLDEAFGGFSGSSSGDIELEIDFDGIDFGDRRVQSPHFATEMDDIVCDECGFSYSLEEGADGVCPVCR